jgi:hypothetical protein
MGYTHLSRRGGPALKGWGQRRPLVWAPLNGWAEALPFAGERLLAPPHVPLGSSAAFRCSVRQRGTRSRPTTVPGPACWTRTGHWSEGPVASSDAPDVPVDVPVSEAKAASSGCWSAVEARHKPPTSVVGYLTLDTFPMEILGSPTRLPPRLPNGSARTVLCSWIPGGVVVSMQTRATLWAGVSAGRLRRGKGDAHYLVAGKSCATVQFSLPEGLGVWAAGGVACEAVARVAFSDPAGVTDVV